MNLMQKAMENKGMGEEQFASVLYDHWAGNVNPDILQMINEIHTIPVSVSVGGNCLDIRFSMGLEVEC